MSHTFLGSGRMSVLSMIDRSHMCGAPGCLHDARLPLGRLLYIYEGVHVISSCAFLGRGRILQIKALRGVSGGRGAAQTPPGGSIGGCQSSAGRRFFGSAGPR